jgi:hypothetical protein
VTAPDVAEVHAAVLTLTPPDPELAQLRGHGHVDGNLIGTVVFRPTATSAGTSIHAVGDSLHSERREIWTGAL